MSSQLEREGEAEGRETFAFFSRCFQTRVVCTINVRCSARLGWEVFRGKPPPNGFHSHPQPAPTLTSKVAQGSKVPGAHGHRCATPRKVGTGYPNDESLEMQIEKAGSGSRLLVGESPWFTHNLNPAKKSAPRRNNVLWCLFLNVYTHSICFEDSPKA